MPEIDVKTEGIIEITRKMMAGVSTPLERTVAKTANFLETKAKRTIRSVVYSTPKGWYNRTGKALQSIVAVKQNKLAWQVKVGVIYGYYLETGTGVYHKPDKHKPFWTTFGGVLPKSIYYRGMPARPFWHPSVKETRKQAPQILQKEISLFLGQKNNPT